MAKRINYDLHEQDFSSSGDEENIEDSDYLQQNKVMNGRITKSSNANSRWLSKNALMARENRRKKKLYVTSLENEVKKLKTDKENFSKIVENQSLLISDLKKEVKYLKSVISNSSDLGNLIKSVRQNTGMSVTTSLDQNLSLNNDYVSKRKQSINQSSEPIWEQEENFSENILTPEPDLFSDSKFTTDEFQSGLFVEDLLFESPLFDKSIGLLTPHEMSPKSDGLHLEEHNYTSTSSNEDDDVGVCLHVSKHRVCLEFCSSCSENASSTWRCK